VLSRLSLRARLVLGVIVLAAAGLAVANIATYTSLRSFLLDRTDQSLRDTGGGLEHFITDRGCEDHGPAPRGAEPGDFVQLRSAAGAVVCSVQVTGLSGTAPSPPVLPESISVPGDSKGPEGGRYFTVRSKDGKERYRVGAWHVPPANGTIVVATPLGDVDDTLGRLLLIELLVTAAVLAALAAGGLWVVRLGLRPLTAIGSTAEAIAGGDLTRRVERAEERTEVGRLGLALNAMLSQIESAFNAQAASEQKLRRFVADASHELRTPLAAVRAYAELFFRGADSRPDDLARTMSGISRESERMSLLVDDLLLLARLDEGRPLARDPVELDAVISEAVDTALAVDPRWPIALDAQAAVVSGDRDRLRQLVDNLLANIRAHTPAGTPVEVRLAIEEERAVLTVADTGPGLTAEEAARAFERFYRADESRSRSSGGVGLGLSIVAAVAEAHGGTVAARDTQGGGATFEISIPLAPDQPDDTTTLIREEAKT
jgi:two-component system OmpR family sensor kinase